MTTAENTTRPSENTFTRRKMLQSVAVVSAATLIPSTLLSGVAPAQASAPVENPELLRLAKELPAIEAEYVAAQETRLDIYWTWSPSWPLAPDEISRPVESVWHGAWGERTFDGRGLHREGERYGRQVETASAIGSKLDDLRKALRRKRRDPFAPINFYGRKLTTDEWDEPLAELVAQHELALAYEAEKARIHEASGFEAAMEREKIAREALNTIINQIMARPEYTMEGVIVKAKAMAAWGKVERAYRMLNLDAPNWGPELAAAVLRLGGSAAA